MVEYFQKGGPVMYAILVMSIYALTVFIERFYYFYKISFNYRNFTMDLKKMIVDKEVDSAFMKLRKTPGPLPAILLQLMNTIADGASDLKGRLNEIGSYEIQKAEGKLKHLAVVGNLTPLLGLLGTVTGMISAFSSISQRGANSPTIVAGGISEALIATAYGLIIAIPAVVAYNYLATRYESIILETEHAATEFLDFIEKKEGTK